MNDIKKNIQILLNLFNATKFNDVISKSKRLIREFPEYLILYNLLGSAYQNAGSLDLAEETFNKGLKLDPNNINLGNIKRDNNDFQAAISLYSEALKIKDDVPVTHYSLALAHQGVGEFEKAINHAEKTLKLDPKFTQADLLISQSINYKNANKHFDQMRSKIDNIELTNNQKINILFALAKAHEDMGQIKIRESN